MSEKPDDRWALPGSVAEPGSLGEETTSASSPALGQARAGSAATSPRLGSRREHGWSRTATSSLPATGLLVDDPSGSEVPRLALRPMTAADILDGAFGIIKARPARLLGLTAVFVVPLYLLFSYIQRDALSGYGLGELFSADDPEMVDAVEQQSDFGADLGAMFLGWLGPAIVLVLVAAAIAHMLGSWSTGRDLAAGQLLAVVGKRSWALLASFVLVHLVEAPAVIFGWVGVVFVMPFFVAVAPVIGAEAAGPLAAVARAFNLVRRRYWPTLGTSLLIGLVSVVLSLALSSFFQWMALTIGPDVAWPLMAVGNILSGVVVTPFTAAATVLLYLDLRVRNEGLDLELAVRDLFGEGSPA